MADERQRPPAAAVRAVAELAAYYGMSGVLDGLEPYTDDYYARTRRQVGAARLLECQDGENRGEGGRESSRGELDFVFLLLIRLSASN